MAVQTARFIPLEFTRRSEQDMLAQARTFYDLLDQRRSVRFFRPSPCPASASSTPFAQRRRRPLVLINSRGAL